MKKQRFKHSRVIIAAMYAFKEFGRTITLSIQFLSAYAFSTVFDSQAPEVASFVMTLMPRTQSSKVAAEPT